MDHLLRILESISEALVEVLLLQGHQRFIETPAFRLSGKVMKYVAYESEAAHNYGTLS